MKIREYFVDFQEDILSAKGNIPPSVELLGYESVKNTIGNSETTIAIKYFCKSGGFKFTLYVFSKEPVISAAELYLTEYKHYLDIPLENTYLFPTLADDKIFYSYVCTSNVNVYEHDESEVPFI